MSAASARSRRATTTSQRCVSLVDEAMRGGALGFSTSRTFLHRVPDGRPVPGTYAAPEELLAIGDVLGRHGRGVFEAAARLGEGDDDTLRNTKAELRWMSELSRRSGRPVTFGLAQSHRRPDLYARVIQLTEEGNLIGGTGAPADDRPGRRHPVRHRQQHALRAVPVLAGPPRPSRSTRGSRRCAIRTAEPSSSPKRTRSVRCSIRPRSSSSPARTLATTAPPTTRLAALASRRGVSAAEAFVDLCLETDGAGALNFPFLNQSLDAVAEMLGNPTVVMGLADAGAHVGQIMDASQPTFFLTYWVREKGLFSIEEAVRRLTTDTATLFGVRDRGLLRPGAFADVNVIDFEGLRLPPPSYVHDFPGGAGRYIQRSSGYDTTIVNGEVFMRDGEHTGALAGRLVRSTD